MATPNSNNALLVVLKTIRTVAACVLHMLRQGNGADCVCPLSKHAFLHPTGMLLVLLRTHNSGSCCAAALTLLLPLVLPSVQSEDDEDEEGEDGGSMHALLGAEADNLLARGGADIDLGSEGDEGEAGEGEDEADFELEDGVTLEEALANMYEEAIAAGIDPEELGIDVESGYEEDEGELDDEDDDDADLLDALEGSSEYETDEDM